jgi:hypothetical protein
VLDSGVYREIETSQDFQDSNLKVVEEESLFPTEDAPLLVDGLRKCAI